MSRISVSRRHFLGGAAALSAAGVSRAAGIKPSDLPDLTITEVKAYVTDHGRLASVVTRGGIEGNYTLGGRYWHPDWNNAGWVDYAKGVLAGKNALDRPSFTSQWDPPKRRRLKVLDFGMAKILSDRNRGIAPTAVSTAGIVVFSAPCAAPEQFDPKIGSSGTWT